LEGGVLREERHDGVDGPAPKRVVGEVDFYEVFLVDQGVAEGREGGGDLGDKTSGEDVGEVCYLQAE